MSCSSNLTQNLKMIPEISQKSAFFVKNEFSKALPFKKCMHHNYSSKVTTHNNHILQFEG